MLSRKINNEALICYYKKQNLREWRFYRAGNIKNNCQLAAAKHLLRITSYMFANFS